MCSSCGPKKLGVTILHALIKLQKKFYDYCSHKILWACCGERPEQQFRDVLGNVHLKKIYSTRIAQFRGQDCFCETWLCKLKWEVWFKCLVCRLVFYSSCFPLCIESFDFKQFEIKTLVMENVISDKFT